MGALVLCVGEACGRAGAARLLAAARAAGWAPETVDCLSLCNGAPCGRVAGVSMVRLTEAKLAAAMAAGTRGE